MRKCELTFGLTNRWPRRHISVSLIASAAAARFNLPAAART